MQNIIVMWSGAIVDIPAGWALCDGLGGTPNLLGKFIVGAGDVLNPGDSAPTNIIANAGISYYALCFIMKVP